MLDIFSVSSLWSLFTNTIVVAASIKNLVNILRNTDVNVMSTSIHSTLNMQKTSNDRRHHPSKYYSEECHRSLNAARESQLNVVFIPVGESTVSDS